MRDRRVILTFHGVGEPPAHVTDAERPFWVPTDLLERTLDAMAERTDVEVTFDDGNRSDVDIALPALSQRGLVARFFVAAGRLGQPGYLDGGDLRTLAEAGMTVGSHGMHHRGWPSLGPADLHDELEVARSLLEDALGGRITEASCPFGLYNRRVLAELRRIGFERVYTSDGGRANPAAWLQPRNTITPGWQPTPAGLAAEEPLSTRVVRRAKRVIKRWR